MNQNHWKFTAVRNFFHLKILMPELEKLPERFYDHRHLMWHPESESLFEIQGRLALHQCLNEGCEQVTGMQLYEQRFSKTKEKKMPRKKLVKREVTPVIHQPLHIKYRPKTLDEVIGHD